MDTAQAAAQRRMELRTPEEARMAYEGQQNAGGVMQRDFEGRPYWDSAPVTEYPRMLYRKTDEPKYQEWAEQLDAKSTERMEINRFFGLLCDTMIVDSAGEAEAAAGEGWDLTPHAAHGLSDGLVKATTAKDEEIAALKAQLAEQSEKRGPGRPPKVTGDGPSV